MNLIGLSEARKKFPSLVNSVGEQYDRFVISVNNKPKAVLLSFEELESLEETAEVLTIPGAKKRIEKGLEDIKKGKVIGLKEFKKNHNL